MLLLPHSQWQAAPAGTAQDEDVDASDSEGAEAAEAAAGSPSGAQPEHTGSDESSEAVLDGALQQLQLHDMPNKQVMTNMIWHLVLMVHELHFGNCDASCACVCCEWRCTCGSHDDCPLYQHQGLMPCVDACSFLHV